MKISEIKDKELRELAELRRSERASDWEYTDGLLGAFQWHKTEEGVDFWGDVEDGIITSLKPKQDSIVESVRQKLLERSKAGINKYNTTLEREDLTTLDWLIHAQEEAMDLANYLEVLIQKEKQK